jgi:hypothetical protein
MKNEGKKINYVVSMWEVRVASRWMNGYVDRSCCLLMESYIDEEGARRAFTGCRY